jgi:transposase
MSQEIDQSKKSFTAFDQASTLIAVVELSSRSWLVAGVVPGIERHPLKKVEADETRLLALLRHWEQLAVKAAGEIKRVVVAFEAGRDGFWLARWLQARGIETYVIHPTSVAVSREHRRAKTDRLDSEHLKRVVLGWLRGEPDHCRMVAIPTVAEEDAKRPSREREALVRERTRIVNSMKGCLARFGVRGFKPTLRQAAARLEALVTPEGVRLPPLTLAEMLRGIARLRFLREQIQAIEQARIQRLKDAPATRTNLMVTLIAGVVGIGIETADILVQEVLTRNFRDRKAVARYAGLTGSPDESGNRRREKGLARAGNARVRRTMVQLAWRFLRFHPESGLATWFKARTADGHRSMRKTMIVGLARKLLIVLWRMVTTGEVPDALTLRHVPA